MPKRIWAYIGPDGPSFGLERFKDKPHGVEYIRADNLPDVDVEDLAHEVRDAAFKTYGVNIDPVWLERILREALEVHSD